MTEWVTSAQTYSQKNYKQVLENFENILEEIPKIMEERMDLAPGHCTCPQCVLFQLIFYL